MTGLLLILLLSPAFTSGRGNLINANSVHVNCLNACSTPAWTGATLPVGTIFTCNSLSPALPSNACPLFIFT